MSKNAILAKSSRCQWDKQCKQLRPEFSYLIFLNKYNFLRFYFSDIVSGYCKYISNKFWLHFQIPGSLPKTVRWASHFELYLHCLEMWSNTVSRRKALKIRFAAENSWRTSRCLEMWSNTILSAWYSFSIETKAKGKTESDKSWNAARAKTQDNAMRMTLMDTLSSGHGLGATEQPLDFNKIDIYFLVKAVFH